MRRTRRRQHAFTLVELLVVIGILALLIGILVPVLGKARLQAKQTVEASAARQLVQAYLMYAGNSRGWLLPGEVRGDSSLSGTDDRGNKITPIHALERWPWRLLPSLKFQMRGTILVNERLETLFHDRSNPMWAYTVSLSPSFGLNFYGLGGIWSATTRIATPAGVCLKITDATRATRRIVFVTARGITDGLAPTPGFHKVYPPREPSEHSADGWSADPFRIDGDPVAWGYVDPRYNGRAIVACLDGHVETLTVNELRDMTRWVEGAARADDPNWNRP